MENNKNCFSVCSTDHQAFPNREVYSHGCCRWWVIAVVKSKNQSLLHLILSVSADAVDKIARTFKEECILHLNSRFDTSVGGLIISDQFLQIATKLDSSNIYGFGEHEHASLRHDMNWRTWVMYTMGQTVKVSHSVLILRRISSEGLAGRKFQVEPRRKAMQAGFRGEGSPQATEAFS
jgi:hypothetical protein